VFFLYKQLVSLLNYDYIISTWSEGGGNQIKGLVVLDYFPLINTINFEEKKNLLRSKKRTTFNLSFIFILIVSEKTYISRINIMYAKS